VLSKKQQVIQFIRFGTVGLGNTAIDFAAFFLLTSGGVPYLLAQVLSYSAGVINSFLLNRKWTFQVTHKASISELAKFIILNGFSLLISTGLLFILQDVNHEGLWLSKIIATAGGIVVNFLGSRIWVWNPMPAKVFERNR
jgi:putative flippase GtrA